MRVTIWGCRGSLPTPMPKAEYDGAVRNLLASYRAAGAPEDIDGFLDGLPFHVKSTYGGNTSCIEVTEGDTQIIFDAGSGLRPLGLKMMGGPCGRGEGVVHIIMTHTHWDHMMGFPFFVPAFIPGNQVNIYGCHSGLRTRFEHQQVYTHFPVTLDQMAATKTFVHLDVEKPINIGPFKISSILQYHPGDSYGYRVESPSGVFVYATDAEYTEMSWDRREEHIEFFQDADVLIFDAAYSLVEAVEKLDWGHSSPFIGVEMANDAAVKKLVLFHHDPTTRAAAVNEALKKARRFYDELGNKSSQCEIVSAYDEMEIDI